MTSEHEQLADITNITYSQLKSAIEAIPHDKLAWAPADGALCPRDQVLHACGADRGYANHIDGGERRTHFGPEGDPSARQDLLAHLEETREMIAELIRQEADLDRAVDIPWRKGATVRFVLLHMLRHKHYHVGQLTLIRHLLGVEE